MGLAIDGPVEAIFVGVPDEPEGGNDGVVVQQVDLFDR